MEEDAESGSNSKKAAESETNRGELSEARRQMKREMLGIVKPKVSKLLLCDIHALRG